MPPWAAWARNNTWCQLGTTVLDTPLSGLDTLNDVVIVLDTALGGVNTHRRIISPALEPSGPG
eukprot:145641-Pyramimonas_sp.AAC.1